MAVGKKYVKDMFKIEAVNTDDFRVDMQYYADASFLYILLVKQECL